jgi:hypothetical protein
VNLFEWPKRLGFLEIWPCLYAFIIFFGFSAKAAPCCSSGGGISQLIVGDEKSSLDFSLSQGALFYQAGSDSRVRKIEDSTYEHTTGFEIAWGNVFGEFFQWGFNGSFSRRALKQTPTSAELEGWGLGDLSFFVARELISEIHAHQIWPQTFFYFIASIPIGESIYTSQKSGAVDAFSRGYWSMGFGLQGIVHFSASKFSVGVEVRKGFSRGFNSPEVIELNPRLMGQVSLNYSTALPWNLPLHGTLGVTVLAMESRQTISANTFFESGPSQQTTLSFGLGYTLDENSAVRVTYSDSTLIPPAQLSSLRRSVLVGYNLVFLK